VQLVRSQTLKREVDDLRAKAIGIAALVTQDFNNGIQGANANYNPSRERINTLKAIAGNEADLIWVGANPTPGENPTALERDAVDQINIAVMRRDGVQVFEYNRASDGERRLAAAAPVFLEGTRDIAATVLLTRKRSAVFSVGQRIANRVWIAGAIGLLAALLISSWLTTRALRPINRLQEAANAVGQGQLDTRVEPVGTAEIDALGAAFNAMVRELRHRDHLSREFLMRITHDLRTPLTAIRGHAQALADGVVPDDMVGSSLAAIEGESARLSAMVTDLLDLANELVSAAYTAHHAEASRLRLGYRLDSTDLPEVRTDASRVRQILGNLIDNAFRWTPTMGMVDVAAHPREGGGLLIRVSDSGPGVPLSRQEEVFEPFRSENTPDGRSGSGLGLAISQQLARALGGDLYIDATITTGSCFILELPADAKAGIIRTHTDADPEVGARTAIV
jgi:two-component system sensor histidine kinase BaeS